MIALPVHVVLRDRRMAIVTGVCGIGPEAAPERFLVGRFPSGGFDLWRGDGRWRYDGAAHPADIVGFLNPDGSARPLTNEFSPSP